ncbi:Uncharacterised protein [Shigella sonnei]|nr:Uncharacterised protein [Shigella sonnei]CSG28773.1 Uncharacterised protein [Shigella sonnei]CSG46754.1 Uncharacterised protein [Shigella sonnei]CSG66962.1 Uncharacterised protein [Shigella sonnei]
MPLLSHLVDDVQRKFGFPHRRTGGNEYQVSGLHTACFCVQFINTGHQRPGFLQPLIPAFNTLNHFRKHIINMYRLNDALSCRQCDHHVLRILQGIFSCFTGMRIT